MKEGKHLTVFSFFHSMEGVKQSNRVRNQQILIIFCAF